MFTFFNVILPCNSPIVNEPSTSLIFFLKTSKLNLKFVQYLIQLKFPF